jgi:hypothetical protein
MSTTVVAVNASILDGNVPVAACFEYDFSYGSRLYL